MFERGIYVCVCVCVCACMCVCVCVCVDQGLVQRKRTPPEQSCHRDQCLDCVCMSIREWIIIAVEFNVWSMCVYKSGIGSVKMIPSVPVTWSSWQLPRQGNRVCSPFLQITLAFPGRQEHLSLPRFNSLTPLPLACLTLCTMEARFWTSTRQSSFSCKINTLCVAHTKLNFCHSRRKSYWVCVSFGGLLLFRWLVELCWNLTVYVGTGIWFSCIFGGQGNHQNDMECC